MNVVRIESYRNRETVCVLEALLSRARQGQISGVAMCFKPRGAAEEAVITGTYAISTDAAAAAALRLSMRLANAQGEYDSSP